MEKWRDTRSQYFKDLAKGKAEEQDFERYVYGPNAQLRKDEQDAHDKEKYSTDRTIERSF